MGYKDSCPSLLLPVPGRSEPQILPLTFVLGVPLLRFCPKDEHGTLYFLPFLPNCISLKESLLFFFFTKLEEIRGGVEGDGKRKRERHLRCTGHWFTAQMARTAGAGAGQSRRSIQVSHISDRSPSTCKHLLSLSSCISRESDWK